MDYPTITTITEMELDLDALIARVTLPSTGAAAIFSGIVRGMTERGNAHETSFLEYEAYQPMAEAKMRQVAKEIRSRWPRWKVSPLFNGSDDFIHKLRPCLSFALLHIGIQAFSMQPAMELTD